MLPARPLAGGLGDRSRWVASGAVWISLAALIAAVQAGATSVDVKLGIVVAGALVVAGVLAAQPTLLIAVAGATMFLEGLTFNGLAVTRMLAPGALLLVALEFLRGGARLRPAPPLMWAGAYVCWAIASGLWTVSQDGTRFLLQSLAIALVFLFAFAMLPRSESDIRRLIYVMAFTTSFIGGLSVIAFGSPFEIPGIDLLQGGRSQGGVGDPDFFAAMQLVMVPLTLVAASDTKSTVLRIGLYCAVLTMLASIFTSLSRGAFLAALVLGALFIGSRSDRLFRSPREKRFALVLIGIGMLVFFSRPFVREEVVDRAETIYAPKTKDDKSGSGRTNLWKAAAKTAGENPILGIGYGGFASISQELLFKTPGVDLEVQQIREEGDYFAAHNTYLGTAAELGLTGLLILFGLIVSTGLTLRKTANRAAEAGAPFIGRVAHALLIGLATWTVTSFFLSGETSRMFWIIVGLSLALPRLIPEPGRSGYPERSNAPTS
jgi:O-antigen ligase